MEKGRRGPSGTEDYGSDFKIGELMGMGSTKVGVLTSSAGRTYRTKSLYLAQENSEDLASDVRSASLE